MIHPIWSMALAATPTAPTALFARPDSTVSADLWLPVGAPTLHEAVDDVTPDDDTTYARSFTLSDGAMELGLSTINPQSTQTHIVFTRARQPSGTPSTITVVLNQGVTKIADATHTLTSSWATFSFTLSQPEVNAITDYADLRIKTTFDDSNITECRVTQQYLRAQ